jgi:hypothetical protein
MHPRVAQCSVNSNLLLYLVEFGFSSGVVWVPGIGVQLHEHGFGLGITPLHDQPSGRLLYRTLG